MRRGREGESEAIDIYFYKSNKVHMTPITLSHLISYSHRVSI